MRLIAELKRRLFRWQSDGSVPLRLTQRRIFILPTRAGLLFAAALLAIGAVLLAAEAGGVAFEDLVGRLLDRALERAAGVGLEAERQVDRRRENRQRAGRGRGGERGIEWHRHAASGR